VTLTTGGTAFTHATKCTYFLKTDTAVPATAVAPSFMLKSSVSSEAAWYDFDLHYVEYVQVGGGMTPVTGDGSTNGYPTGVATNFYPDIASDFIGGPVGNFANANGDITGVMPGTFQCGQSDMQFSKEKMESYTTFNPAVWSCEHIIKEQREYR